MGVIELVQQLGVPVAFALIFAGGTVGLFKYDREDRKEEQRQHKEEVEKLTAAFNLQTEAFNNNTLVLSKLVDAVKDIKENQEKEG